MDSMRDRAHQELAFRTGRSKAHFGQSAHNYIPAIAIDVAPYPIDWNNPKRFFELQKVVMRIAHEMNVPLTWGGDWDGDGDLHDQKLVDLPHYELKPWRDFAKHCKLYGEH
jgi:peptidoglycan L-alanyl-D-glutamate endopeptidase CwlK